ncbi:primosomal protein N' [Marinobacterium stanieri]|uniref:Replication restart protein PriA n=1 Tax=Marinobacterium stanieri TaxID=49186 RepID=A0A1N6WEK6_9GAMM|nr:primosomal protein N' [Marinobacterium stanieri]SIQ88458.1 replication restart DNA helicase PriA [Marinobacterium stanieri]
MLIFRLAIPSPLHRLFDYRPPVYGAVDAAPGCRVRVPFGNREVIGILVDRVAETESDCPPDKLKAALEVLDEIPVLCDELYQLTCWAARYYQHPLGDALQQALPVLLRQGQSDRFQHQTLWRASQDASLSQLASNAHRQRELLQLLLEHPQGISTDALKAEGGDPKLLRTLESKGLAASMEKRPQLPHADEQEQVLREAPLTLNNEQGAVVSRLQQANGFLPLLLEGVTGSGKTEVYLQAIQHVLEQGKQALVLVPEIGLTPQTTARFKARFNVPVLALHSGMTDRQRLDAWLWAREGSARILIGTRSAIFTPLKHPGIIIVDEEHDGSFKQQDGFRYHARDLAVYRARQLNVPVLLGSATPSLESLQNALSGRFEHLRLTQRAGNARPPKFELMDIKQQTLDAGLSSGLLARIHQHLRQGTQVLIFLNRRGFSPALVCHDCGTPVDCTRCDARMTLHRQPPHLHCHHCDRQTPIPRRCSQCGSDQLRPAGSGTERIEDRLQVHFPDVPIHRVDRDSTQRKNALERIMTEVHKGEPCILVGTQMLAKGHHFPKVTLVAILDADAGLFSADFRGMEKTAQLTLQVAGRAGRADHPGEVVLQTMQADHPMLNTLVHAGYEPFAREELRLRQGGHLPPFSHHALIRAEANRQGLAENFLLSLREWGQQYLPEHVHCIGPFPALMEKRAGLFRAQMLIQAGQRKPLHQALALLVSMMQEHPEARRVRWTLDVDPIDSY